MTPEDRKEVRQMFTDILSGHVEKIDGQYRVILAQLSSIEIQTTKTNGRVSELESKIVEVEKDILTHPMNCNIAEEVKDIKKDLEEYRMLKKYPKVGIGIILVATLLTWYGFRQINNRIEKQGIPVVTNSRGEIMPLPDSTKILWLYNDSAKYMVKKVK